MDTQSYNTATELSLIEACSCDMIDVCVDLLKGGANIEIESCGGFTPLHIAVLSSSWQCVDVLLKYGANVTTRSASGCTLLHTLACTASDNDKDLDIAMDYFILFIQLGADVDATAEFPVSRNSKLTALCLAKIHGHTRIAEILMVAMEVIRGYEFCEHMLQSENSKEKASLNLTPPTLANIARNHIRHAGVTLLFISAYMQLPSLVQCTRRDTPAYATQTSIDSLHSNVCGIWRNSDVETLLKAIQKEAQFLVPVVSALRNSYAEEHLHDDIIESFAGYDGIPDIKDKDFNSVMLQYIRDIASLTTIWQTMYDGEHEQSAQFSNNYLRIWMGLKRLLCKTQYTTTLSNTQIGLILQRSEALEWYHRIVNALRDYSRRVRDMVLFRITEEFLERLYLDIDISH